VTGGYDADAARVWLDFPYDQAWAPDFVEGVELVESQNADMSIAASVQAVISNATVSSYINSWSTYHTTPRVDVADTSSPSNPDFVFYDTPATLAQDGSWSATIPGGTAERTYYARACHGASCTAIQAELP
jgi:hypothetical protein